MNQEKCLRSSFISTYKKMLTAMISPLSCIFQIWFLNPDLVFRMSDCSVRVRGSKVCSMPVSLLVLWKVLL